MENVIRIGKHLIGPSLFVYLLYLSTLNGPLAEKYLILGDFVIGGLAFGYAISWIWKRC